MDVKIINPFLEATTNVLATMANMECTHGKVVIKDGSTALGYVSGIIEITDKNLKGSLALSFSSSAISAIAKKMLGEMMDDPDTMVRDLTGELTNIIAGGAKKILSEKGYDFGLAIPTILNGNDHEIIHVAKASVIVIPFSSADGDFYVEVCFQPNKTH